MAIKGITSESQFQKWIDLAGSVTKALLLFLITIPRRPPVEGADRGLFDERRPRDRRSRGFFSEQQLEESNELFKVFTGKEGQFARLPSTRRSSQNIDVVSYEVGTMRQIPDAETLAGKDFSEPEYAPDYQGGGDDALMTEIDNLLSTVGITPPTAAESESMVFEGGLSESVVIRRDKLPESQEIENEMRRSLLTGRSFDASAYKDKEDTWHICALDNMLKVLFRAYDVDLSEGFILQVEICRPGMRHPNVYAFKAMSSDPAARIAIKISYMTTKGNPVDTYAKQAEKAWKEPMLLNAVFDWFSGFSWEEIALANKPRRYIDIKGNDKRHHTAILSRFIQGEFTGSSLTDEEERKWKKEKENRKEIGLRRMENALKRKASHLNEWNWQCSDT